MKNAKVLSWVFTLLMIILAIAFVMAKRPYYLYNLKASYIGYLLLLFVEKKWKFTVENYIRIMVIISILAHLFMGQFLNYYLETHWFDNSLHLFGSFSFSLLFYNITSNIYHGIESKSFRLILIASMGITVGVMFETLEFALDMIMKSKNQDNLLDTNLDLIFNSVGAILAGLFQK